MERQKQLDGVDGRSLVHNSDPGVIQMSLDAGADVSAKGMNIESKTAWDLIEENDALKNTDVYWELNPTFRTAYSRKYIFR